MECYLMSGDFDYLVRIIIRDNADYVRINNKLNSVRPLTIQLTLKKGL
jgi:DNA-binding Lrp family transcriptional regulator